MEVEIIKAKGAGEDTSTGRKIDRLRVAAYCRVSTDDEDQIKSYNSMVRYYTDLIKSNKQWVFAGVFADKAITGTKTDKREEFQLLIQECLSGNIDLVIAKSIPRFARNTLDTLKYVRMLRERNIAVYFEVEKINTLKDGEFLLTILSSVAQQEVENTSAYVKKGLKMKMKRGELVGFQGCLGYDYDVVTKSLSINEEGAETVRYIFDRYVAGAGSTMIARELNEQGISTIKGNPWTSSSVMGIINNEKYKGDILLGKTFTVDPISKRRLENLGEEDRFYIKNHHEPIVSEETFARAQEIRERRNGGRKKGVAPGKREKFSRQYAFSCMLECGFCGANLSRRRWHSSSKYTKTIWQCVESTKHGKRFCPDSKGIPEQVIEDAFIESYRMLCTDHKDVLEEFIRRVEKTLSEDSIEDKIEKLNRSVYNIQYKRKKLLENYLEGVVAKDIYEETDVGYEKKLSEAKAQLSMLEQQYDNEGSLQRRLADFRKALSKNQILEEFDRGIFESIIEKVIVGGYDENGEKDPYKIIFIYKTGFKNEIGNAKERFGKKSKAVETVKEMCSHIVDEVKDVCSYVGDNTDCVSLFGTNNFNLVWEKICADIMDNQLLERLGTLKLPVPLKQEYNRNDRLIDLIEKPLWSVTGKTAKDTLIPDMVSIFKNNTGYDFIIFDAKYYNARLEINVTPKGQPGIESVTKQYLYQLAYQKFINEHDFARVRNCFLMPTEEDKIIKKGEVSMKMLEAMGLENIKVRLIPAKMAYEYYLSGRKMNIEMLEL